MRVFRHLFKAFRISANAAHVTAFVLISVSLVPSDEAYSRAEHLISRVWQASLASQYIKSVPSTTSSIVFEYFQGHFLELEGVKIDLDQAVNHTQNVREVRARSEALDEDRTFWVYLPPGYEDSDERYPSLYLLHGMSQDQGWWTEVARIDRIATSMIHSGKIRPLIIVMPNGNRVEQDLSTTSLYDNRCETGIDIVAQALRFLGNRFRGLKMFRISCDGDFESYIVRDVVATVDASYRTNGERYIGGFSLGGRGAVQLALANSKVFDGAFGLSGNYEFSRRAIRAGDIDPRQGMRLFLASGDKDQRGLYGNLNTFLFHKELVRRGVDHLYCIYDGTHGKMAWVAAMPAAMQFMLATDDSNEGKACGGA